MVNKVSNVLCLPKRATEKINLTTKRVRELPTPPKGTQYHFDTQVGGLCVRVGSTGAKSFVLSARVDGTTKRITLGKVGAFSLSDARKAALKLNGEIALGIDVIGRKKVSQIKTTTMGALFLSWEAAAKKAGLRSASEDGRRWRRHFSKLNRKPASSLTRGQLQAAVNVIGTPIQENRCCALLSRVFNHAIKMELFIGSNPAKDLTRNKERSRERFLTADEIHRFIDVVKDEQGMWRGYFLMLIYTGARRMTVAKMRWTDVDLNTGVWSLSAEQSKNKKPIELALTRQAIDLLKELKPEKINEYVFASPTAKGGHIVSPQKAFKRLADAASIDDVRIHDLRRTVGSVLAAGGASNFVISKVLGHADLRSAEVYARLDTSAAREALEAISGAFGSE